jgi:hypothetical protein
MAALLVGHEAIPAKCLGSTCGLARAESVAERDAERLHTIWLCHTKLTPKYREYVEQAKAMKQVYHLRSLKDIAQFYQTIAAQTNVTSPRR